MTMSKRKVRVEPTIIIKGEIVRFPWGEVVAVYEIGPYAIVEFYRNRPDNAKDDWATEISFHLWVDGKDTNHSYHSLDHALVAGVVKRNEDRNFPGRSVGANEQLSSYVMRILQPEVESG